MVPANARLMWVSRTNEMNGEAGVRNWSLRKFRASTAKTTPTAIWPASFCFERRPRLRCLEIFMKSSRNPMIPSPVMRNRTSRALIVGSCRVARWAARYATSTAPRMIAPPIVGVPRLVWCDVGPSSRMNWP